MKLMLRRWLLILPLACHAALAMASPTSDDYVPCHRMASLILLECLNNNQNAGDHCWNKAKSAHKTCYADVVKSYQKDSDRIKAEKLEKEKYRQ